MVEFGNKTTSARPLGFDRETRLGGAMLLVVPGPASLEVITRWKAINQETRKGGTENQRKLAEQTD